MGIGTVFGISVGSIMGAFLRYALSVSMNALLPGMYVGTLTCNLIAAYVVGLAIAFFGEHPGLSPAWRLFAITGLAGGLSTFSTFSAERLGTIREARFGLSAGMIILHVGGSVLMTALGMATLTLFRAR